MQCREQIFSQRKFVSDSANALRAIACAVFLFVYIFSSFQSVYLFRNIRFV